MSHHWAVLRRVGRFTGHLVALEMCTHLCTGDTQQLVQGHTAGCMALACSAIVLHKDALMKQGCPDVPVLGHSLWVLRHSLPVLGHSLPVVTHLPVYRSTEVYRAPVLYLEAH